MIALARLVPTSGELREMARIAAPIVVVNLGLMLQGTIDTVMLGRVSSEALAAGAVGSLYFFSIIIFGIGLLMSLDPVVAQALGARDDEAMRRGVQRGVILAVLSAIFAALLLWPAERMLTLLEQPEAIIPDAAAYVRWSIAGLLPFQLFNAFRQTLQAMHRVLPMASAVVLANLLNVFLNWVFIYGNLGVPAMGVVGAAHATWITRWVMVALILWFAWRDLGPALRPWRRESFEFKPLARMIAIGAPVGLQLSAEGIAFGFTGIMMGWLGTVTLAGHQVTLSIVSLTFMVPMGVAGAGAVMVGRAVGAGDMDAARRDAVAALVCGVGFMMLTATLFMTMPGALARLYTPDGATIAMVLLLLPVAGVFQVFDGMQVVSAALLRGIGDTRVPMVLHLLSFWAVGIPLGAFLSFTVGWGATGLWWGLTAGLASAGVLQLARVRSRLSRDIRRLHVD
jgi:MATE family multidrug resistance protein